MWQSLTGVRNGPHHPLFCVCCEKSVFSMLSLTFPHTSQSGDYKHCERQTTEPQDYEQSQAALFMAHLVPKSTDQSDEPWENGSGNCESSCISPDPTASTPNSTVRVRTLGLPEFQIYHSGFQPNRLQKPKKRITYTLCRFPFDTWIPPKNKWSQSC